MKQTELKTDRLANDEETTEMTESIVQTEIDRLISQLDGELTSHSRVIDAFLDLRSAAGDVQLVAFIDDSLRNIPGRTAVSNDWFKTQLTTFRLMLDVTEPSQN